MRTTGPISSLLNRSAALLITLVLFVGIAGADCMNYTNDPNCPSNCCNTNAYCVNDKVILDNSLYCKQICIPYDNPGCCSYNQEIINYTNNGDGCPCGGQQYTYITAALLGTMSTCKYGLTTEPCQQATEGGACLLNP
jgi:hypothetical protein